MDFISHKKYKCCVVPTLIRAILFFPYNIGILNSKLALTDQYKYKTLMTTSRVG